MEFFEVVKARYSHKAAFIRSAKVPAEHLRQIVEAGMAAACAMNKQSPEFVIVNDDDLLERIGQITQHKVLGTAPALIAVVVNPADYAPGLNFHLEDYAAATENIVLAVTALGYACGWIDAILQQPAVCQPISGLLGIPQDRRLMVLVPIGLPAEPGPRRPKKPFEERASWNRYAVVRN